MNSYKYLAELVQVEGPSSFQWRTSSLSRTPKVEFLLGHIRSIRAKYPSADMMGYLYTFAGNRNNIVVFFPGMVDTTIGFVAHHDIVNPKTDNVFDNQASVSHLMALTERLAANPPFNNILICFTDGEEVGGIGATQLAKLLNGEHDFGDLLAIINLELTAAGSHFWVDESNNISSFIFRKAVQLYSKATHLTIGCPFNDSVILRQHGIDSACVGMIGRNCVDRIKGGKEYVPRIWDMCHSHRDKMELAREAHMLAFTDLLESIALHDWTTEVSNYEFRKPRKSKLPPIQLKVPKISNKNNLYALPGARVLQDSVKPSRHTRPKNWWEDDSPY